MLLGGFSRWTACCEGVLLTASLRQQGLWSRPPGPHPGQPQWLTIEALHAIIVSPKLLKALCYPDPMIRVNSEQVPVKGPVQVRTQRQPVANRIVVAHGPRHDVAGI
jgi:hypothetical protein